MNDFKSHRQLLCLLLLGLCNVCVFAAQPDSSKSLGGLVQLNNNLDEPRGICFDIAGFRDSIDTHIPLQAHTCKPDVNNREDGLFVYHHPNQGNIYNAEYDLCLDAVSIVERGNVFMRPCSNAASQMFNYQKQELQLTGADGEVLCLAVSPSPSHPSVLSGTTPKEGATFVARTMALANCAEIAEQYKQWRLPTE